MNVHVFSTSLEEEQHYKFYIFYSLFPLAIKCIIKMDILVEYITSTVRDPIWCNRELNN